MKILLHDNSLNVRGTTASIYEYASGLKKFYNFDCHIAYNLHQKDNNEEVICKIKKEFNTLGYNTFEDVDKYINQNKLQVAYFLKSGEFDSKISHYVPNIIHAVFPVNEWDIHGDKFAFVSEWLSNDFLLKTQKLLPFVPHIVNLPNNDENYRTFLNIPKNNIVFGRYGGFETFNIPFVHNVIKNILNTRQDITFLFCNTKKFVEHPNAIFLGTLITSKQKVEFINTCDAFLHARDRGETFGLAVLEFMSKFKPVITFGNVPEKNHIDILLKENAIIFNTEEELKNILNNFLKHNIYYNNIDDYTPAKVIKKFIDVFLKDFII